MSRPAPEILWRPDANQVARTNLAAYEEWLERAHGRAFADYAALWQWSVDDLEGFWGSLWEYLGIRASVPYERVLGSRALPGAEWFPGSRLNFAEHCVAHGADDAVAILHASELRPLAELSRGELRAQVARAAAGLRALGVSEGDRVAAYLPNVPEAVVGLLACASLGAIWSSCSPDFGLRAVADRFTQIEPKVLLAVDGYRYAGRDFDRREVVASLLAQLPSVEHTVVIRYLDPVAPLDGIRSAHGWEELLALDPERPLQFAQVGFAHPLWVLYSSGTTGPPKAIVHGHGGVLLELMKVLVLHVDLHADDRILWFTTTGWMMWNFLVGGLTTDAGIVLFDGSPATPDLDRLWDLAETADVSILGVSAAYVSACMKGGVRPRRSRSLARLRAVGSTGSPLAPEAFDWLYAQLGPELWVFSTSGGTDVCTAFVGGVPTLPVTRGELQARSLGARIESWSPAGRPLVDEVGELVITAPLPSMPLFFWNDPDGSRYRTSYFDEFPGVWRHGDWIEITSRGTAIISGRSDATINRAGVRIGTAELYRSILTLDEIVDALVVDLPRTGTDGWMVLFVVLRPGVALADALVERVRARLRADCSPRHLPDEIRHVPEVPRTLSGKLLELPVKRILMGLPTDEALSRDALANPAALEPFEAYARSLGSTRTS